MDTLITKIRAPLFWMKAFCFASIFFVLSVTTWPLIQDVLFADQMPNRADEVETGDNHVPYYVQRILEI